MLKGVHPGLFGVAQKHGLNTEQTENLIEAYETEFGKSPSSFGDLLEVLE